jgi:hypothetical protein
MVVAPDLLIAKLVMQWAGPLVVPLVAQRALTFHPLNTQTLET